MRTHYVSVSDNEEDKIKLEDVYEQLKLSCYHVALGITKNPSMAEDAIHNAFVALIEENDKVLGLPQDKRKAWIIRVTKNKASDLLRGNKKLADRPIDDMENILEDEFDLSGSVEKEETLEYMARCLERMPEKYKAVLELRYVYEKSNTEIAEILGITPKNVSTRIGRAEDKLKKMMGVEYYGR